MAALTVFVKKYYRQGACLLVGLAFGADYLSRSWGKLWWTYRDETCKFSASFPGGGFKDEARDYTFVSDYNLK